MSKHKDKSDAELAADAKMVAQELASILSEFERRGIETDILTYSGKPWMQMNIYRTNRTDL